MRGLGRNFIWNQTYDVESGMLRSNFLFSKDKSVNSPANMALLLKSQPHCWQFQQFPVSHCVHWALSRTSNVHGYSFTVLFLHFWSESWIIIRGHVIDHHLLQQKQSAQAWNPHSIYSFWCEHNTSQFHTFGWIKLLTLGEILHLSYKHLRSACDSGSILSVTGWVPQGQRKAAHLFLGVITVENAHVPVINGKRPVRWYINIMDQMRAAIHLGLGNPRENIEVM